MTENFRDMVDHLPILICSFLPDFTITYINAFYKQCFRNSSEEIIGKSFLFLIPDQDHNKVIANISSLTFESPVQVHEHRVFGSDGIIRWHQWSNRAVFNEKKEIVSYLAVGEDITERKRVTASQSFLNSIVDNSPVAMWVSDSKGVLLRTNRSLREILNIKDEQILGIYNVFKDENLEIQGVMPDVKAVFQDHKPARFCVPWEAVKAGDVKFEGARDRYIDVSMFPILNSQGELLNVVCQWSDITEIKNAEIKMQALIKDLELYRDSAVERENAMIKLKKEVNQLTKEFGRAQPYDLTSLDE